MFRPLHSGRTQYYCTLRFQCTLAPPPLQAQPSFPTYPSAKSSGESIFTSVTSSSWRLGVQAGPTLPTLPQLQRISTPLLAKIWEELLTSHPDPTFSQYIIRGIRSGFRTGPQGHGTCRRARRNLRSGYEHPEVIEAYLAREVQLGRVIRLPRQRRLVSPISKQALWRYP